MTGRKLRITLVALGASLSWLAAPSESKAFWDLFHHHSTPPTTYNMPVAPCASCAAPCATCQAPCGQVCNYVPQTCYRTVYVNMPVTAYQPVTTADPCTGCPRTCMRPVTSYMPQARLIPYTTYRPVMTNVCNYCPSPCNSCSSCGGGCASGACGSGCASGACGGAPMAAPALNYYPPAAQPGCSSCGSGGLSSMAPPTTLGMPGSNVPSLTPSLPTSVTVPSTNQTPATQPYGSPTPSPQPESTFQPNSPSPEPSSRPTNATTPPRLLEPQDRMTARPIQQASAYKPVSAPATARVSAPAADVDFDGWQASK